MKVLDYAYKQDERLNFFAGTILPAIENYINEYVTKKKIAGEEIEQLAETRQYYVDVKAASVKFLQALKIEQEVEVLPEKVSRDYKAVCEKIEALENDPDVHNIRAVPAFQQLMEQRERLQNYTTQIAAKVAENEKTEIQSVKQLVE
jgi:hypothetical protein